MIAETPLEGLNVAAYTVSELSAALRRTLEDAYGYIRVRGEISGFKRHSSGHCYFALKDDSACLNAVCWRSTVLRLSFKPQNGLEVVATGRVSTFPSRSKYQLIAEQSEPAHSIARLCRLACPRVVVSARSRCQGRTLE